MKKRIVFIITIFIVCFTFISCFKKEKTIEDYDINEVLILSKNDFNDIVLNNDCDFLSTININKKIDDNNLNILIDKKTSYDIESSNTYVIKNNIIKYKDIVLDYDNEQYIIKNDNDYTVYDKSIKNEIYFPWYKYNINQLTEKKQHIVEYLFNLIDEKDFNIDKVNKNSSNNNVLTIVGKLNSIQFLDYLSTEFISSKTPFLNDIDLNATVIINELDKGFRFNSLLLNSANADEDFRFDINISFEMKDISFTLPNEVDTSYDFYYSYDEYLLSALIDTENDDFLYDKLNNFSNEFYDLYNNGNILTGSRIKQIGEDFIKNKIGTYFDATDKIFSMEEYFNEKVKHKSINYEEYINDVKKLFSGKIYGEAAIDLYSKNPDEFQFDIQMEKNLNQISIYNDLSIEALDVYSFTLFERNYELISIYTNDIGLKIYEFKSKENKNDIYKYLKFIENTNISTEATDNAIVMCFSDKQGEHYFDGKEAYHFIVLAKEDSNDDIYKYFIDFMFDIYDNYDLILNKINDTE